MYKFKWIIDPENVVISRNYLEVEMSKYMGSPATSVVEDNNDSDDEFTPSQANVSMRRISTDNGVASEIFYYIEDNDKQLFMLSKYPSVCRIFRKFNTTLSSSAPIERLFSLAMLICTARRNRMSNENFEKTLLLKKNICLFKNEN